MPNSNSAQPDAKKNNPTAYFGTQTMGCATTRPDGKIIRVTMLDARDPGFGADWGDYITQERARRGSEKLLAAILKLRAQ